MNKSDKTFIADDKCDSCAICVKICPVNNITMKKGKPEWHNKCEGCLTCFHWCPKAAIQSGEKTKIRGRYHHPDISLSEMLSTNK